MQYIIPHLWFDTQAEEAAQFYTSIIRNSEIGDITRYGKAGAKVSGRPEGSVMTVEFKLNGQKFIALNGGPFFEFTPAVSFMLHCETQQEIDELWEKLTEGGKEEQCGWLRDKYGVSWQVVPSILDEMLQDKDAARVERVTEALLAMVKLDIQALEEAYEQR